VSTEPTLSDDRLNRRQEHLMSEITLMRVTAGAGGPRRSNRERRSRMGIFAGLSVTAAVIVAAVFSVTSGSGGVGPAAFEFQRISNGTVSVTIVNTEVAAEEMTRQLQKQGLNVTVRAVPAGPQLVGLWLTEGFSADVPEELVQDVIAQVQGGYTASVKLPQKFSGTIDFEVGRAAEPGEAVMVGGIRNALAPGARLGCLHATLGDPKVLQKAAVALGYTVTWADGDPLDLVPIVEPATRQRVVAAFIQDATPTEVQLVVATPGTRRYLARAQQGYGRLWETRDSNPSTCTAG
jgi:hypothetical protein